MPEAREEIVDLFIIGGGVNGCGIARDAAGRGLRVRLAEKGDLGSGTSSASTKLFHGGLRYLEFFEFRLVREALQERETLYRAMPHISWPMRFVLPINPAMRFRGDTPAARLLGRVMPWLKGRRPAWVIRLALLAYDRLGGRHGLRQTRALDLERAPEGRCLRPGFSKAFEYSDCWVDDARLVVLNARDARARGADILPRTEVLSARRADGLWDIVTRDGATGATVQHRARFLVNASGAWADAIRGARLNAPGPARLRLVRGSHIITRRLYDHKKCYFFQGLDGRIIFAIPYEDDYTLIGTTDCDHPDPDVPAECSDAEQAYLCEFASSYFGLSVRRADIVWTYSGLRALYDDGASTPQAATRDYVLQLDADGPPLLSVFGGKITTYRRLAEAALDRIGAHLPLSGGPWTAGAALPGGNFDPDTRDAWLARLRAKYPFLTPQQVARLFRTYGTETEQVLGAAQAPDDLGPHFGSGLTGAELRWLVEREFARTAQDVLWRRTKLGLRLSDDQAAAVAAHIDMIRASGP